MGPKITSTTFTGVTIFILAAIPSISTIANVTDDAANLETSLSNLFGIVEKSRTIRLNDFLSLETIVDASNSSRENARHLDRLEDLIDTRSLNVDSGPVNLKLFRKDGRFNLDLKLHPRRLKHHGFGMLLPFLLGFKGTGFLIGVITLIGLLAFKAFVASKTAMLLAVILGLKKLFANREKAQYDVPQVETEAYYVVPEHYQLSEPEPSKSHIEVQLPLIQEVSNDQHQPILIEQKLNDDGTMHFEHPIPIYEIHQPVSPDLLIAQTERLGTQTDAQKHRVDVHQKRRTWKLNRTKQKPLSLVIGNRHHAPPVLTYRKVVEGRNL